MDAITSGAPLCVLPLGLDVRCGHARVRPLVGIDLRLEVGGPLHKRGGKRRI